MDQAFQTKEGKSPRHKGSRTFSATAVLFLLATCLLGLTNCTKSNFFGQEYGTARTPAILQDIKISENNGRIVLLANKPLKYTLHNISEPPRTVVDLHEEVLSPFRPPVKINTALLSQIDISKKQSDGHAFTRVIFKLKRNVIFSAKKDPSNDNNIILTATPPQESTPPDIERKKDEPVSNAAPVNTSQPDKFSDSTGRIGHDNCTTPKNSTQSTASDPNVSPSIPLLSETGTQKSAAFLKTDEISRTDGKPGQSTTKNTVSEIKLIQNGIEIALNGLDDNNIKFFKLTRPQRLVIDLFGARNSLERKVIPANRFGIKSIRVGTYPHKVRIVLDASEKIFPACRIKTDNRGISVLFTSNL